MISAFDSFISYLNTELAGTPPVNWVRVDDANTEPDVLKENALNLSILGFEEEGSCEEILVSLDLIAYNERTAFQWAKKVRDVLLQQQFCPERDYETAPDTPTSLGRNVSWRGDDVMFSVIQTAHRFVHLNATFHISHTRF